MSPSSNSEKRDIPIGREVPELDGGWQCQYGSDGTVSGTSLASGFPDICQEAFPTIDGLKQHYASNHSSFREYNNPFLSSASFANGSIPRRRQTIVPIATERIANGKRGITDG